MSSVNSAEMRIFLPLIPMLDETPKDEGNPHFSLEDVAKLKQVRKARGPIFCMICVVALALPCPALPSII